MTLAHFPLKPFHLGPLRVDPPLLLAPMAGVTHAGFRQIVGEFGGCGLFFSEMLSSRAIPHEKMEDSFFLRRFPGERPLFYQVVGNDPDVMARAIRHLESEGHRTGSPADGFDINMGCGAPPIRNNGCGVGLMKDMDLARRVVSACRKETTLPLTAKMRLGWEESFEDTLRFAQMLEAEGVDGVTLHPRLAKERFRTRARWRYVGLLKKELRVPVIGNGDIRSEEDVHRRFEETGCDGIMIGRLAVERPWIFSTAAGLCQKSEINLIDLFDRFVAMLELYLPEERRLGRLKEYTEYFARNFRFGHRLFVVVQGSDSVDQARRGAKEFFERNREEVLVQIRHLDQDDSTGPRAARFRASVGDKDAGFI